MAFLQRDSAIAERNNALLERDNAIATLQYRENSFTSANTSSSAPGYHNSRGVKHMHHQQQHIHHLPHMNEDAYGTREMQADDAVPISPVASEAAKPRRGRQPKGAKATPSNKKISKSPRKVKRESEDLNMFGKSNEWKDGGGGYEWWR
ncbi:PROTEIN BASIC PENTACYSTEINE6 [Salix koriyanagi]|uniref:GAGA-binding transcriptional activator n=1 Tax=Salix koriyanagi TaxID=2511006 RepID=A0A9Q0P4H4_9ROSI|nr:PROTEIN BASIC PENTACYSTEINE6 [Salix koriyanagi]